MATLNCDPEKRKKVKISKVMTKKSKYAPSRESEYEVEIEASKVVTITREESSIRTTLCIGETAIYAAGHVNHFGEINKISDKSVTIKTGTTSTKRLDMHEFCKNNFNLSRD